ncbi:MAG: DsbC family protein [Pseudomonadota bacterium]
MKHRKLFSRIIFIIGMLTISEILPANSQDKMPASAYTAKQSATEIAIKKVLGNRANIDSVSKTPYSGLYEVRIGNEIIYTDEKAQYIFMGNILDSSASVNYTQQRIDEFNRVNFSELPLSLAIKTVKGNGKRVITTFEDPNCGPCKQLRKNLHEIDNITIYTFMYNVIAETSAGMAKNIWCASNKEQAWDQWMLNGVVPTATPASCVFQNEKILALGEKLNIRGTPAIIFADGSRAPGVLGAKMLEEKLASLE